MKKLLALALTLVMVLSLSVTAFAEEPPTDMNSVTISMTYEATNTGTTSPEETFQFTIAKDSVTDAADGITQENMPLPRIGSVQYAAGDAGNAATKKKDVTITLPAYTSVGIYTYTVTATRGTTAGVAYWAKPIKLVVTVIEQNGKVRVAAIHTEDEGGQKSDAITNTYSAGSLAVTKNVTGNMGDRNKYFKITVTLTGEAGKTYAGSYPVSGGSKLVNGTGDAAASTISIGTPTDFYLKHDETFTIANLPYGVTYTVVEENYSNDGYTTTTTYSDETSKKIDTNLDTVTITNNKGVAVDTGIALDSLPYVLLLAVSVVGMAAFVMKKRAEREF